ncbi:hypothetical protein [Pseudoalteromonas sp. SR41-1]|uniref:hypothetical protein n=1 Tax=Pseudoalteromonas sp. SR41-1 TaxID=2760952 RepID=UPI00160103E4|nr:hypothetical protein [Pseudoalteromonas sp. SR41-1]MBB1279841.1 hypothetical protein [Pseudoalteromonas sp. SR41-1]
MYSYLPFEYTFKTRIKTKAERLSWFIIFPFALALISVLQLGWANLFQILLTFLVCMSSYEIGYIYNDNITTENEVNPTERVNKLPTNFSYKKAILLCFLWFIALFFSSYLLWGGDFSLYLIIAFSIIQVIFYMHNVIRNRFNIFTYFGLVSSRYLLPVAYFIELNTALFILFIFPVCRTIEHACKVKYGLSYLNKVITNFDLYRVFYYLIVFITVFIFSGNEGFLIISSYFLVYRVLAAFIAKKNFVKRNKHPSYK